MSDGADGRPPGEHDRQRTTTAAAGPSADERKRPPLVSPRQKKRLAIATGCFVLVVFIGATAWSLVAYRNMAFWDFPERIEYCGRTYYPSQGVAQATPADFVAAAPDGATWRTVKRTPTWHPLQAAVVEPDAQHSVCTMVIATPTGEGTYQTYVLSGAP